MPVAGASQEQLDQDGPRPISEAGVNSLAAERTCFPKFTALLLTHRQDALRKSPAEAFVTHDRFHNLSSLSHPYTNL